MNIPKGYRLVPVVPTDDMIVAFAEAWYSERQAYDDPEMMGAYRDMLAAAPTPPKPIYDEAKERELFGFWSSTHEYLGGCTLHTGTDGIYADSDLQHAWESWKACAQSGAKAGEDE